MYFSAIMRHLYVHVPFCRRRCSYCDFSIAVRKRIPSQEYVAAVLRELELVRAADPGAMPRGSRATSAGPNSGVPGASETESLETVYLGGGTPSLLPPDALAILLPALLPSHLSLYGLTVEKRTPLARWISRGAVSGPDDERYADEYLFAHERLAREEFRFYEVSNAAREGRRSRHNSAYWSGRAYLGLGPAAHSYDGRARRWNIPAWDAYRRALAARRSPVDAEEVLTEEQRELERLYLSLRTDAGVSLSRLCRPLPPAAALWMKRGWVEHRDRRLICTPQGWLRLDALVHALTGQAGVG